MSADASTTSAVDNVRSWTLYLLLFALFSLILGSVLYAIGHDWTGVKLDFWWAWEIPTRLGSGLAAVWPLFVWATIPAGLISIYTVVKRVPREQPPLAMLGKGLWISLMAGVFEEITFRWILMLGTPVVLNFFNWFGIIEWLNRYFLIPIADFMTLGLLSPQLHSSNWLVGAAIISASVAFRDQHQYLGLFGYVNAWFLGMVFFWLTFNYGILTAMAAHFLYDAIIFSISALAQKLRPEPVYGLDTLIKLLAVRRPR